MSNLYASIDSDTRKTQATARGRQRMSVHVRGWNVGVEVVASSTPDGVVLNIYRTGGSHNSGSKVLIQTIREDINHDDTPAVS